METREKFMRRCVELAEKAAGSTYPNPLVGAVIVHDGRIIGEGYHLKSGGPHAEVIAIDSVKERSLLGESTLYVNLEPCTHFGKTPPCADLIVETGIPSVVVGTVDPNIKVAGKGIQKLKEAGRNVTVGILEKECRLLNKRFLTFHEKKRPYIILKWAESSDGVIDIDPEAKDGRGSYWISGMPERVLVHRWRATEQSIQVGGKTIRVDNPGLDVRYWEGPSPLRLVLRNSGDVVHRAAVFRPTANSRFGEGKESATLLFTHCDAEDFPGCRVVKLDNGSDSGTQILEYLYMAGIQSLIIQRGAEAINQFSSLG